MNIVEEFLHQPIPTELWHYTTINGFAGIVSSGTIWASEVHSSRDRTEFVHAADVAETYLASIVAKDKHRKLAVKAAEDSVRESFAKGHLSHDRTEIFIASFSSAGDRKSQWVDYSDGGRGVAIVMDLRHVRPPVEMGSAVTLAPCVYQTTQKRQLIEHALSYVIEAVDSASRRAEDFDWTGKQLATWRVIDSIFGHEFDKEALVSKMRSDFTSELRNATGRLSVDLFRLASHCKHHGYFEEYEWRLALPHTKADPLIFTKVEYRGEAQIPYVAHRIGGLPRLPILRVVAGFACTQVEHVKRALAENGYDVPVVMSELPEVR